MNHSDPESSRGLRDLVLILGIPFDNVNMEQLVAMIDGFVASGQPHLLTTANVNFVAKVLHDPEFLQVVQMADVITADGMPILWAGRLLGCPLRERVTGSDLVPRMTKEAADKGYRILLLGGAPGVGDTAVANLQKQYPGLDVHAYSPPFDPLLEMNSEQIIQRVRQIDPDLLFVSFAAGKSEKWLAMNLQELGVPLCAGVGATIDFLAGRVSRAPVWMQRSGVEWIYRIYKEPRRMWRRYAGDLIVFSRVFLRTWIRDRFLRVFSRKDKDTAALDAVSPSGKGYTMSGRIDATNKEEHAQAIMDLFLQGSPVFLFMHGVVFIDSSGLGMLVGLEKEARRLDVSFIVINPSEQVMATLRIARLDKLLDIVTTVADAETAVLQNRKWGIKSGNTSASVYWVQLWGRIDASVKEEVQACLIREADASGIDSRLELDLSRVDFMDSSGLIALISLHKHCTQNGKRLVVVAVSSIVQKLFTLMRMDKYLVMRQGGRTHG